MNPKKTSDQPRKAQAVQHRLKRMRDQAMKDPVTKGEKRYAERVDTNAVLDCGWGRLIFGQTFTDPQALVDCLREEQPQRRDIAFYIRDPHVVLAAAPQEVFLDPSHTFRLDLATYRSSKSRPRGYFIRRLASEADATAVNRIYETNHMVPVEPDFFWRQRDSRTLNYLVAEDNESGEIIGTVTGVDHERAFADPEKGSSLWCLAVEPTTQHPGVGEALVRRLSELFQARGCAYMDLSVLHDNEGAIALYEKLGFRRVPFFTLKRKNVINEKLFIGSPPEEELNIYARIMESSTMIGDRKNGLKDGVSNEWFATFDLLAPAKARGQEASVVIDRPLLQDILLSQVGDCVNTGVEVVGYESQAADPSAITGVLANGTRIEADMLVGSDGIWSKVRGQEPKGSA